MIRAIAAVLLGLVVALATMLLLQYLGMSLFPLPPGITLEGEQDLILLVESATTGQRLWVLMAWILASLTGGLVAARIGGRHRVAAALWVGGLIVAGVLLNAALLPHPAWMTVAGALLPVPLAWLAARLATPRGPRASP